MNQDLAEKITSLIFRFRIALAVLVILGCISGSGFALRAIKPSNTVSIWFTRNDPALKAYYEFQEQFGNDRILILVYAADREILHKDELQKIRTLTSELGRITGVDEVKSLTNVEDFRRIREGEVTKVRFTNWFDDKPDLELSEKDKEEIRLSPMVVNRFLDSTGRSTLLMIVMSPVREIDAQTGRIIEEVKTRAGSIIGKQNVHMSGTDIIADSLNKLSRNDFTLFAILGFAFMFAIVGIFYRRSAYMGLIFIITVPSIWLALGIYGAMGFRINIFTIMCPPLVITLGITSLIHIINEYEKLLSANPTRDTTELTKKALINTFRPCLFSTATTIIGFSSLYTSATAVLKEFAFLSSAGFLLIFLLSMVFCSFILPLQKTPRKSRRITNIMERISAHIISRRVSYTWLTIFLTGVFLFGITRINTDMYPLGYFPRNHQMMKDHHFLEKNWGSYYPIDMVVKTDSLHRFSEPESVAKMTALGNAISAHPIVRDRFDFVRVMERYATVAFRKSLDEILADPFLAQSFTVQFTKSLQEKGSRIISNDLTKARITVTGPMMSTRVLEKHLGSIDSIASLHLPDYMELRVVGYPSLFVNIMNYAFDSMRSSLYTCFILIFISIAFLLRSVKLALLALVPNVFPVIVLLGFLGLSGINLDLATCTIAAIVLGISVDDTIFFLYYFRQPGMNQFAIDEKLKATYHHVGRAILISTVIMLAGFSVMLFSSLKTAFYFGLLSIISLASAAIGEIIMLPILLHFTSSWKKEVV